MLRSILCIVIVSLSLGSALAADAPAETLSLFDGKSLHGWTVENQAQIVVEDELLVLKGGNGWLRSDFQYTNFVWHVEWKALQAEKYDAGLYIRTPAEGMPFPKNGYQVNLLQDKEGNIGNLPGAASTGLVKRGEWNAFDITVVGDTVALAINGKPAYKAAGLKNARGYIGIQCEVPLGGQYQFRNLQIQELGFTPLFNGKDLAGWEGAESAAELCWKAVDGVIQCTGEKGPWLRTAKEYDDFTLRYEYQVSPGGNSGIYVRVPKDGNHHRKDASEPAAGFEVQVIDDAAPEYKALKDYQYSASVYDISGATPRVCKPAGEWNSMEITCKGQQVTVQHNGKTVVHITAETHPLLALRSTKGFLGLQNHSTKVLFRNLRVGPAE